MSSTTDPTRIERARGQVLVIFVLSLTALLAAGALAFDAGLMYVERRDQQNAADAAALAGARYLPDGPTRAVAAARAIARENGFEHGVDQNVVNVTTPYLWSGKASGEPSAGFIEVQISNTRPSFFAGILGIADWPVAARAVAANEDDVAVDFSILSLHETACPGLEVAGSGLITAAGDIQVDSACTKGALKMVASGTSITVQVGDEEGACSVHGTIKGDIDDPLQFACETIEGAPQAHDPFENSPDPPDPPAVPWPMEQLEPTDEELEIPDGCPGSDSPATSAEPAECKFNNEAGSAWRMYPGLYPGGLKLLTGTFYLEPGVYYIEGGGLDFGGGGASVVSVDPGTTTPGGGVLIYNTGTEESPAGPINLNGGDADFYLEPYEGVPWDGFIIFQDRTVDETITLNGGDSDMTVHGLIYAKLGHVKVNGSDSDLLVDQIIADTFYVSGSGGTIDARRDAEFLPTLTIAGLVE